MSDKLSILTLGAAMSAGGGGGTGDGDMKKAVYDGNDDGIVDAADNATTVNNHTVDKDVPSDAKFTDTVYDDTSISNRVSAIEEVVPSDATSSNKLATQSDLPSAVTGNPSGSSTAGNLSKLQIGNDIYDVPSGGSGNTVSKTRYQISSSSWSSSANSDGFYTLTATLNPAIGSSPDVYVAGSADGTQPTDTEKGQFAYVKRCKVNGSTLTLYASSKPSSTFYIWVEGVNGTGSGDIVGNVIQPNGESSGGSGVLTPFTLTQNDRLSNVQGGYRVDGDIVTVDLFARLLVEPANTIVFPDLVTSGMDSRIVGLPVPRYRVNVYLDLLYLTYTAENDYAAYANGFVLIDPYPEDSASLTHLVLGKYSNLNLSQQNIYIRCYGTYQKQ